MVFGDCFNYLKNFLKMDTLKMKVELIWVAVAAKGGGATGAMPPLDLSGGGIAPPWLSRIKRHISKDRMKIKENLKTCALKKFYIKKDHNKSKTRAIK